jgi:DNA-binding NarL/FixJ family response regulator
MISIIIVDDHPLVRAALVRLLAAIPDLNILAEASSGEEALFLIKTKRPDLILLDLNMPGIGGLATISKILRYSPKAKIIVISHYHQEPFPSRALKAGAKGYLTKGANLQKMEKAIQTVMAAQIYLDPDVTQALALKTISGAEPSGIEALSKRELDIVLKIIQGLDVDMIAQKLCISPKTVNTYRYRIHQTLNIENDVQLVWFARQNGLLDFN